MKIDLSRFDQEQKEAINAPLDHNIIVSASAGSGKTGVLVNRIVRLCVEEHIDITRILALTFTEAAAAEMKGRIAGLFNQLYSAAETKEDAEWLHTQLIQLSAAHITTIDSFCLSLIKKYYNVLGIDPAMAENIAMSGQDEQNRLQAYHEALSLCMQKNPDGCLLLLEWISPQPFDYDTLYQNYIRPISNTANASIDPDQWYDEALRPWYPVHSFSEYPQIIQTWFWNKMKDIIPDLISAMRENVENASITQKYTEEKRNAFASCLEKLDHAYAYKDYHDLSEAIMDLDHLKASTGKDAKESSKRITQAKKDLAAYIWPEDELVASSSSQAEVMHTLIELIRTFDSRYAAIKHEKKCMTFSDMERFALAILTQKKNEDIITSIQNSYDEILVDEFQDTSELQNAIIERIAHHDNTFRVGDVKQSIYRFRNASPELMTALMQKAETDPAHYMHITLKHNYRSKKDIVDFANTLFSRLMAGPAYSTPFNDDDISFIGETTGQDCDTQPVTYLWSSPWDEDEKPDEEEKMKLRCQITASRIYEMKQEHPELPWRQFAVLVRNRKDMNPLKEAFDLYGIPYDMNARDGFYASDLCLFISALIKAIQDPQDSVSLYAVMTSELFHYTDEQLASELVNVQNALSRLKKSDQKITYALLAKELGLSMDNDASAEGIHADIFLCCKLYHPEVLDTLKELKDTAKIYGAGAFLRKLSTLPCSDASAEQPVMFYERLDHQSRYNFDYLISRYSSDNVDTLASLLHEIEAGNGEKSSEAVSIGRDDDVVQTATIHGSKGLQYGYTFLISRYDKKGRNGGTVIDPEMKFGIDGLDQKYNIRFPSFYQVMLKEKNAISEAEESIRLFYVAVTRAVKKLYIVDVQAPDEGIPSAFDQNDLVEMSGKYTMMLLHARRNSDKNIEMQEYTPAEPPVLAKKQVMHNPLHYEGDRVILPDLISPSSLEDENSPVNKQDNFAIRLPSLSFGNESGTDYGTMMHRLCEILPDTTEWTRPLIYETARKDHIDAPLSNLSCDRLIDFYHSDLHSRCQNMTIYHEYGFYINDPTTHERMNGSMDFVAVSSNRIILIDFKTDKDENNTSYIKKYSGQLNAYRRVLNLLYPDIPCEAWIWSFHNSRAIPIDLPDSAQNHIEP